MTRIDVAEVGLEGALRLVREMGRSVRGELRRRAGFVGPSEARRLKTQRSARRGRRRRDGDG